MELTIRLKQLHQAQKSILTEKKRFNVIKCGRRFGKTELAVDLVTNDLLDGKIVGYWTPTYKDLYEVWNILKFTLYDVIQSKDETVKQIVLITGGKLDMWSMEDPNSGRGRKYHKAIIDEAEKARHFKEAWEQTIRPTLSDFKGDAWFFSTPKFGRTYFKEIFDNPKKFDDWTSWRFTTYDNPYIDPVEIDSAKAQLDDKTFQCEYLALDVDLTDNPFAYAFSEEKHTGEVKYDSSKYLALSFDFNVDPITAIAAQDMNILKEFRLENSDIYELCDRIKATYQNSVYLITGDATGHNRSALTKGNINYYTVIKQKFGLVDTQMKQPSVNPSVGDSRVLLNSILQNGNIVINKDCKYLIDDLKYVEVDENGDINKLKDKHQSHLLDCLRYYLNTFYKNFIKY